MQVSKPIPLERVRIIDSFWTPLQNLIIDVVIPYQWEALNDRIEGAQKSQAVYNYKIAAGLAEGNFHGFVFQDTDVTKWIEAASYSLILRHNEELEKTIDQMVEIIEKAQLPDGYINTYFQIKGIDKRWTNLYECHELYTAGHLIEAAVAYYRSTGKDRLLQTAQRFADHIIDRFGKGEGKLKGYPGHQEIELALVKLYEVTRKEKYLNLSEFFILMRGQKPNFFYNEWKTTRAKRSIYHHLEVGPPDLYYCQAHQPVLEQTEAVGHAVRALYMYAGMADVARHTNNRALFDACIRLWDNVTLKKMYITGGVGSTHIGEAFTFDYDLPNDTMYNETCASIALIFFAHRMLQMDTKSVYADVIERALYNVILASMSRDGKHFFYVNPLEVWPEAIQKDSRKHHVKLERQKWFDCACCPPNVARFLTSLGQYIYTIKDGNILIHLYIGNEAVIELQDMKFTLRMMTDYPKNGNIHLSIENLNNPQNFTLSLRIPEWCQDYTLKINGKQVNLTTDMVKNGYLHLQRIWENNDSITLSFKMDILMIESHPYVRYNANKVAIQRGPIVYCLEEVDNGPNLSSIRIPVPGCFTFHPNACEGHGAIVGKAFRLSLNGWNKKLYQKVNSVFEETPVKLVPYYFWGNRGSGEMMVWLNRL